MTHYDSGRQSIYNNKENDLHQSFSFGTNRLNSGPKSGNFNSNSSGYNFNYNSNENVHNSRPMSSFGSQLKHDNDTNNRPFSSGGWVNRTRVIDDIFWSFLEWKVEGLSTSVNLCRSS